MPSGAVVDTTVFAAILLREPGWRELATRLSTLRVVRAAPFFRFECANVLWKRRAAMSLAESATALDLVWSLPVDDAFSALHAQAALEFGREHSLAFYDSAFIALADAESLPLWTLDGGQAVAARRAGVKVVA